MKPIIANQTWNNFLWPEWVAPKIREQVESFWSEGMGRGPADWVKNAIQSHAPKFGIRVRMNNFQNELVTGRFVFAWNNIGRLVGADGEIEYVSIMPFEVSRDGLWQKPQLSDFANEDEPLPFYGRGVASASNI